MKIKYEVEDGYAGKSRPQYVEVDDEDLNECETLDDKIKLIDELVDDDFNNRIYPVWDRSQIK